jgi:tRNA pseudouridine-54 N-methylase
MTESIKLAEIQRLTYRSESSLAKLITKAVSDGITFSVKKGFYADTPELREWIRKLANGEKV